jgi:hypothetical protein
MKTMAMSQPASKEKAYLSQMKSRIALCNWSRWLRESNCSGTALYITGERPREGYVGSLIARAYLSRMVRIDAPIVGCLAAWQGNREWEGPFLAISNELRIAHLGVITSVDPVLITHRKSLGGKFVVDEPFREVKVHTTLKVFDQVFYLPTGLNNGSLNHKGDGSKASKP